MHFNFLNIATLTVILVEPEGKNLQASLMAGKPSQSPGNGYLDTIAEGIKLKELSYLSNLMINSNKYVEKIR